MPANASPDYSPALTAISCPSTGNCAAVGWYEASSGDVDAVLFDEVAGRWSQGVEASLPADASARFGVGFNQVSCASAGNCVAVGSYTNSSGFTRGLLVEETSGHWGAGVEVSPPAGANEAELKSVSCPSAGNCVAVGGYWNTAAPLGLPGGALILNEASGNWSSTEPSLPAGANAKTAAIGSVSCPSAGNCTAVGSYESFSIGNLLTPHPLLLTEVSGTWNGGVEMSPPANEYREPGSSLGSVSCPSVGNCAATGGYFVLDGNRGRDQGWVVSEVSGRWGASVEARVPAGVGHVEAAGVGGISCASAGNCMAVGGYGTLSHGGAHVPLILGEVSGHWRREVPVSLPLDAEPDAALGAPVCASTGNCVAVGDYTAGSFGTLPRGLLLAISTTRRPPAPTCTMTSRGSTVALHGPTAGLLQLTLKCDQRATYRLTGELGTKLGKVRRWVTIAASEGSIKAKTPRQLKVKVPASAIARLKKGAKGLANFYLNAANVNGTRFAYADIYGLRRR